MIKEREISTGSGNNPKQPTVTSISTNPIQPPTTSGVNIPIQPPITSGENNPIQLPITSKPPITSGLNNPIQLPITPIQPPITSGGNNPIQPPIQLTITFDGNNLRQPPITFGGNNPIQMPITSGGNNPIQTTTTSGEKNQIQPPSGSGNYRFTDTIHPHANFPQYESIETQPLLTSGWSGGSAFSPYTYMGGAGQQYIQDQTPAYQPLQSYKELQERNSILEEENRRLKAENTRLLEMQNHKAQSGLDVTPGKVKFLRDLASDFEASQQKPRVFRPRALQPHFELPATSVGTEHSASALPQADESLTMQPPTPNRKPDVPLTPDQPRPHSTPDQNSVSHTQFNWEESITGSGIKKVLLVSDLEVYMTQSQLSQALHYGDNPRKLTISLLNSLFSREQLAKSNAKGLRVAHNSKQPSTNALPPLAVKAIKQFVLNKFKTDSGVPCMTESSFNNIINPLPHKYL